MLPQGRADEALLGKIHQPFQNLHRAWQKQGRYQPACRHPFPQEQNRSDRAGGVEAVSALVFRPHMHPRCLGSP